MSDHSEQVPPYSAGDEAGVISCCLQESIRVGDVAEAGGAGLFYELRHRRVFEVMMALQDSGQVVDLITVKRELGEDFEKLGGLPWLSELMDTAPSPLSLPTYLAEIVDKRRLRIALEVAVDAVRAAKDGGAKSSDVIDRLESGLMRLMDEHSVKSEEKLYDVLGRVVDRIEHYHRGNGQIMGLPWGFEYLDKMTGGAHGGQFIVLAARPGCGKTGFAGNVAEHLAGVAGVPVGFFTLEMMNTELAERMLFSAARANVQKFRTGFSQDSDLPRLYSAQERIKNAPLWLDDSSGLNILQIRSKARRMVRQHGVKIIFVDYVGLMHGTSKRQESLERMSEATNGLKALAKELNIPVVALAQLNRENEKTGGRPALHHLRDSGSLEQDADVVMFLWETKENKKLREEYEKELPASKRWDSSIQKVTITVAKQRGGVTGDSHLDFFKFCTRFQHTKFGDFDPETMVVEQGELTNVEEL